MGQFFFLPNYHRIYAKEVHSHRVIKPILQGSYQFGIFGSLHHSQAHAYFGLPTLTEHIEMHPDSKFTVGANATNFNNTETE
jgi:hypothetical protein